MNKCEKNSIVIDCVVCLIAKKQRKNKFVLLKGLGPVWYVCLKTENCCLKTFVEIRVGEKIY